ncbi:MAG: hypothetical protein WBW88_19445 [Rhodothermales bacterium]
MNASRYLIALLLAIALSISGCGLLTDNSVDVDIRTDANSYVAAPGNSIMLTTINRSSEPLYFACYGWIDLQQVDGGRVIRSWYISGREQCGVVTLEGGDSTVRQYLFDQDSNLESITDADYDSVARYRFRFRLFKEYRRDHEIDRDDEYSNEFSMVNVTG